jgi:hypothetical protein
MITFDQDAFCSNPRTERVRCNILRLAAGCKASDAGWLDTEYTCADAVILFEKAESEALSDTGEAIHYGRAEILKYFGSAPCPPDIVKDFKGVFVP